MPLLVKLTLDSSELVRSTAAYIVPEVIIINNLINVDDKDSRCWKSQQSTKRYNAQINARHLLRGCSNVSSKYRNGS